MFQRPDADQFLEELDDTQFEKWKAFCRLEPFGPYADDQRHGMQMALVANVNRDKSKKREPFEAADFMTGHTEKRKAKKRLPLKVLREQMEAVLGKPNG